MKAIEVGPSIESNTSDRGGPEDESSDTPTGGHLEWPKNVEMQKIQRVKEIEMRGMQWWETVMKIFLQSFLTDEIIKVSTGTYKGSSEGHGTLVNKQQRFG